MRPEPTRGRVPPEPGLASRPGAPDPAGRQLRRRTRKGRAPVAETPGACPEAPLEPTGTRERIFAAAADVFGRRGFKSATVREICRAAGASIAAVNYHFGDKEGLYLTVLEDLLQRGIQAHPPDAGLPPDPTAEDRLHAFVRAALFRLLGEGGWYGGEGRGQLLAREITDPSPLMDALVDAHIRPQKDVLVSILRDLLGPRADPRTLQCCALSVMGQCLHYAYGRPIIERLQLSLGADARSLEVLARHITEFSLGGIARLRAGATASTAPAGVVEDASRGKGGAS